METAYQRPTATAQANIVFASRIERLHNVLYCGLWLVYGLQLRLAPSASPVGSPDGSGSPSTPSQPPADAASSPSTPSRVGTAHPTSALATSPSWRRCAPVAESDGPYIHLPVGALRAHAHTAALTPFVQPQSETGVPAANGSSTVKSVRLCDWLAAIVDGDMTLFTILGDVRSYTVTYHMVLILNCHDTYVGDCPVCMAPVLTSMIVWPCLLSAAEANLNCPRPGGDQ